MTYLEEATQRAALIGKTFEQPIEIEEPSPVPRRDFRWAYIAITVYLAACAVLGFIWSGVGQ